MTRGSRGNIPPRATGPTKGPVRSRPIPPRPSRKRHGRRSGASRGRMYAAITATLAIVAAVVVVVVITTSGGSSNPSAVNYTTASGVKIYGGLGPEGVPLQIGKELAPADAGLDGATIAGVECNTQEQLAYHHHVHLAIFVNGHLRPIPLGVGMVAPIEVQQTQNGEFATGSNTCLYWLHVHAQDGIVHIESPTPTTYELAQFFEIWHVPLSANQIGSYRGTVTAMVNGKRWSGNPDQIPLTEHAQIVLNLGGPIVTPPPIDWSGTNL